MKVMAKMKLATSVMPLSRCERPKLLQLQSSKTSRGVEWESVASRSAEGRVGKGGSIGWDELGTHGEWQKEMCDLDAHLDIVNYYVSGS